MLPPATGSAVDQFDTWIRGRFVQLNSQLEDTYAGQLNRINVDDVGEELKTSLLSEGEDLIAAILDQTGVHQMPPEDQMYLLGNVGFFMAACRRHEITEPSRERTSPIVFGSQLANVLGGARGVVPRFTAVHNQTHNRAVNGSYRTFTTRSAERTFVEFNTRSAFAYMRAADALARIPPMGVSSPMSLDLFVTAEAALIDALSLNHELASTLDVEDFYFCVRPYYKSYRVGSKEFRGANAGDFAAFNQIDMILGLCDPTDPSYAHLVLDKRPFLTPDEQRKITAAFATPNLFDELLAGVDQSSEPWFQRNGAAFVRVCDALGELAAHHHNELVIPFLADPSAAIAEDDLTHVTASGPPLQVLLHSLEALRDQRLAADRTDIPTRHSDMATLRSHLRNL